MKGEILIIAGMAMIFVGFFLLMIGTLLSAAGGDSEVESGGVIMIGPIPIVFGTGRGATIAMVLALVLMVLWIVGALLLRRG
ncbi:MAG: hypothetical protein PWQ79_1959 [Thermococcaceae archaeon]|nr:hypothetical protein [Thermococcaceae archaeon]